MHYQSVKRTPGQTRAFTDKHYTLSKSSNWLMTAARRRQGQQLSAGHGPPRRPWPLPLASACCGTEATQPNPEALPPEAWPRECNAGEESADCTSVQWQNPGSGGDEQFQISLQHQGGALETMSVEAHTAFQPALRSSPTSAWWIMSGQAAQKRQGQTAKQRQGLPKHNSRLRRMAPIC